jgi:hypothetical protein
LVNTTGSRNGQPESFWRRYDVIIKRTSHEAAEVTSPEPAIDEIDRDFTGAEAFTSNGTYYAKLTGIIVIAAAPSTCELREQLHDYFGRTAHAAPGDPRGSGSGE